MCISLPQYMNRPKIGIIFILIRQFPIPISDSRCSLEISIPSKTIIVVDKIFITNLAEMYKQCQDM